MTQSMSRFLAAFLIGGTLLAAPAPSFAANQDCGQPFSNGAKPSTSDALTILKEAVGGAGAVTKCDDKPCVCDVNSKGGITSSDALLTLKVAVGAPLNTISCTTCNPGGPACTSAEFQSRPGSDLDSGWTGLAHNSDIILGASIKFETLRRCSVTTATTCERNADCPVSETCKPTCDCNGDTSCEIKGPSHTKNCANSLKNCTTNTDCLCAGNTDCGDTCEFLFGPPLPLSSGGTPACILSIFDGPLTGTADSSTGSAVTASNLKSRVFLGISLAQPCPRCGKPTDNPKLGDTFTCEGGGAPQGTSCTVDGVSKVFGGTSFDCPPATNANISGTGLAIRFQEVTTGTTTKSAKLPCAAIGFKNNPLSPGSNPKCTDHNAAADPVCSSNADCKRCTGDSTISCASNTDCTGNGACAEAPDQPITCGYWCNCGFCNNNPSLPCFETADCPAAQTCQIGTGSSTAPNAPQQKPNDCSGDKFVCGQFDTEKCATTQAGKCTLQSYRNCNSDATCISNGAGTCDLQPRSCFEPRITRTGKASPLGHFCSTGTPDACTTNTDCKRCSADTSIDCTTNTDCDAASAGTCGGAICAGDSSAPETAALFCVPSTSSSAINSAGGITGPGAIHLNGYIKICRCGDGVIGCDEQCDDGNTANGDGCNDRCQNGN